MSNAMRSLQLDLRSLGGTGLRQFNGFVREEFLQPLTGREGALAYREMVDNDPVVGGIWFIIDKLVRMVPWYVEEASSAAFDREAAEHLESCMHDMDQRWNETVCEMMSMGPYGYSLHEIVYKMRLGRQRIKAYRSKYADGRIGWRGMPIRSQDTIWRWHFDKSGDIVGAEQIAPPQYKAVVIPMSKALLFRTTTHKNNPEGRSMLRSAYRSWAKKQALENFEGIGCERDLAGLPVAWAPPEVLAAGANGEHSALYNRLVEIVTNIRNNEQASLIMPLLYDDKGNKMYDISLMASAGSRQFDTDKIIQRYDNRIAISCVADFLLMGQSSSSTGSFAMHTDKTKIFALAIGTFLDIIRDVLNDVAVPRLMQLNNFKVSDYPRIAHGKIEQTDIKDLAAFIVSLSQAGMPLFPNPELENFLCEAAGIPKPMTAELSSDSPEVQPSKGSLMPEDTPVQALHDDASLEREPEDGEGILDEQGQDPAASRPARKLSAAERLARAALGTARRAA